MKISLFNSPRSDKAELRIHQVFVNFDQDELTWSSVKQVSIDKLNSYNLLYCLWHPLLGKSSGGSV